MTTVDRLPITVITGFLGSGKTTLIRALLAHPALHRTAVIVNELGEVPIDHLLIAQSSESVSVLANGCLCCVVRTDLQRTLRDLRARREAGTVMAFDRVIIETSGMADPVPIMQAPLTDARVADYFHIDCIATTVDAINGASQIERFPEALRQVAIADRLIITKRDLVDDPQLDRVRAELTGVNPHADIAIADHGALDPAFLANVAPRNASLDAPALARWLRAEPAQFAVPREAAMTAAPGERYLGAELAAARHRGISSFVLWFDAPFEWGAIANAMQVLANLRGTDLLRVKGLLNVVDKPGPLVLHGAQHVFHPPLELERWPSADRRSRIVFITHGVPREAVAQLLNATSALAALPVSR